MGMNGDECTYDRDWCHERGLTFQEICFGDDDDVDAVPGRFLSAPSHAECQICHPSSQRLRKEAQQDGKGEVGD